MNAPIDGANTALHVAAELGDITIFNALLERGAGINIKGTYATTPLHYAAQYGRIAITQKLIG